MMIAAGGSDDGSRVVDPSRVSDEDLLHSIGHDLAAVYTDVLRLPVPDRIAEVVSRLETTVLRSPDFRLI